MPRNSSTLWPNAAPVADWRRGASFVLHGGNVGAARKSGLNPKGKFDDF
jgi:hypothetical protein